MAIYMQKKELTGIELHRVHSALRAYGVSFLGSHQLMTGQLVTSLDDRLAIAALVASYTKVQTPKVDASSKDATYFDVRPADQRFKERWRL
jgi:hypothetical protein